MKKQNMYIIGAVAIVAILGFAYGMGYFTSDEVTLTTGEWYSQQHNTVIVFNEDHTFDGGTIFTETSWGSPDGNHIQIGTSSYSYCICNEGDFFGFFRDPELWLASGTDVYRFDSQDLGVGVP